MNSRLRLRTSICIPRNFRLSPSARKGAPILVLHCTIVLAGCVSPVAGTHGRNARYYRNVGLAGGRGPRLSPSDSAFS